MSNYAELKRILELWEQGLPKDHIVELTGISRYTVRTCIDRYGSVAKLDEMMGNQSGSSNQPGRREYHIGYKPHKRKYTDEELRELVASSFSMAEVLRKLNIRPAGGNYDTLKRRIDQLRLDTSHFTGKIWSKGKKSPYVRKRPIEEILVKDSTYMSTQHLKERLLTEGIFAHQCMSCNNVIWLGQPIPLELHHVNGDRRDNRLENSRLLCPNCHALTETYRGKNKGGNAT